MEFRTKINIPESDLKITHRSKLMSFGSCFAENIANLLEDNKFNVCANPFGIIYNPASISTVLHRISDNKRFTENDLFEHSGLHSSFLHHGSFSNPDKAIGLSHINQSFENAVTALDQSDTLIITFGTSYVYKWKETNEVVSNCHKLPDARFERRRLSVQEIVEDWDILIEKLRQNNQSLNILFTVSPIRHWKDGAHDNQLSKAILLLAIDTLQKKHENIHYFPSYEIVMDELRDYRFYADDMIHPSPKAIEYIWELFRNTFFDKETELILKQWKSIEQVVNHRPFNIESHEHKVFLRQTLLRLDDFKKKYPYFDSDKEKSLIENQLSKSSS